MRQSFLGHTCHLFPPQETIRTSSLCSSFTSSKRQEPHTDWGILPLWPNLQQLLLRTILATRLLSRSGEGWVGVLSLWHPEREHRTLRCGLSLGSGSQSSTFLRISVNVLSKLHKLWDGASRSQNAIRRVCMRGWLNRGWWRKEDTRAILASITQAHHEHPSPLHRACSEETTRASAKA